MNTSRLLMLSACILCTFSLSAQLNFKLQLMPDGTRWGVYVNPDPGIVLTPSALTATAQVTLVAPLNYTVVDLTPVGGNWVNNANVNGPAENPTKSYISFGLVNDPPILYSNSGPTLLFTFKKAINFCPDELHLIENLVDPFDHLPNSINTNPGNEITVFDFGANPPQEYSYSGNYAPFAWDCHDCDGDGIANALEDTNGNGVYDSTIDVSDLCNGSGGGGCLAITGAQLHCQGGGTACGNNPAGQVSLVVDITGGEAPFAIKYSDGSNVFNLTGYQSGTPFTVDATNGAVYSLVSVIGNDGCEANATDLGGEVPVTFPSALQFVTQPVGTTVCNGEETTFTACATASNATFSFSWQYSSDNGTTWQAVPLGIVFNQTNTSTIADGCDELVVGATFGLQGYRFRAVASGNGVPTAYSQAATLQLQGPVQITAQPQNATVCAGEGVVFTATISNNGAGTASYQWQTSSNGGLNWVNIADNTIYSGSTTASLNVSNSTGMVNRRFRLSAQVGTCTPVYSDAAQLAVEGPVEILSVISPVSVCRGADACFEVQAALLGNGQLSYQWQERATGSTTWADVQGASAPIFCMSNTEGKNGYCYRALVRTASCPAVTSVEACLVVEDKAVFAQQPQNLTTCAGEPATLTASAAIAAGYAGQVDYRWQTSADGGQSWQDLDNNSIFTGVYGNALSINDLSSLGNLLYRLSATSGICEASYSDAATVAVEGPVEISEQPAAMTVCHGSVASFSAGANLLGAGNLQLQWQSSTDGISWANIAEGNNYTGTQSGTLTVQNTTASRMFRLGASTGVCEAKYSAPAMLTVEAPILFSLQPETAVVCPDETASFSIAVGGGLGALSLQWQSSLDGQTWTDLAASNVFAGVNSENLSIADVAGLDGVQFRLAAASQNCHENSASAVLVLEEESICNPTPTNYDCVSLAVKKLDGGIGWSVWVKADSSFTETPYQLPTGGKVTLVAPVGFAIQALTSHNGGKWKPGKVIFNPAQDPGKVYFEFNLTPNQNFLQLTPGAERLLFTFSVVNGCPNSLSLMDAIVPPGFYPNEFTGFGAGLSAESIPFHTCGIYSQETWECPPALNLVAPTGNGSIATGQQLDPMSSFEVAPNPVRDELKVVFDETILEKTASLRLLNLQGQVVFQSVIEGEAIQRLNLIDTTPGIYFLTLEVDGKLVQREKIIVQ